MNTCERCDGRIALIRFLVFACMTFLGLSIYFAYTLRVKASERVIMRSNLIDKETRLYETEKRLAQAELALSVPKHLAGLTKVTNRGVTAEALKDGRIRVSRLVPTKQQTATRPKSNTASGWDGDKEFNEAFRHLFLRESETNLITGLAISPNNRWLASADATGRLGLWDLKSGRFVKYLWSPGGFRVPWPIHSIVFTKDSQALIASGTYGGESEIDAILIPPAAEHNPNLIFGIHLNGTTLTELGQMAEIEFRRR